MSNGVLVAGIARQVLVGFFFVAMVVINSLATSSKAFGSNQSVISDENSNPFTPAGYTFSVWGVIYFFQAVFVVYQALPSKRNDEVLDKLAPYVVGNYVTNFVWLVVIAQRAYGIGQVIITSNLIVLVLAYRFLLIGEKKTLTYGQLLVEIPVSLNLSWVVAANFASLALTLTAWGWTVPGDFAAAEAFIAGLIAVYVALTRADISYSAVAVWALIGVLNGDFSTQVVDTTCIVMSTLAIAALLIGLVYDRYGRQYDANGLKLPAIATSSISAVANDPAASSLV